MKLRNLFLTVMAGAALLLGCNKEVDLGPAKLEVETTELTFDQAEGSQEIQFLATRDWVLSGAPSWVVASPETGHASSSKQTLRISVLDNSAEGTYDRSATLALTIGFARTNIFVEQAGKGGKKSEGSGTLEDPYTVAGVSAYIDGLGSAVSPNKVFVSGKISSIKEVFSAQYGNAQFTISDDGTTTGEQFTAYRVLYLGNKKWVEGNTQIKVGDEVVIYGNVVNYNGTKETNQGSAFVYSLNGVNEGGVDPTPGGETVDPAGAGTQEDPFNVAAAIAKAAEVGTTASTESYYIKGKVKTVSEQFAAQYGSATFTMVDEGGSAVFTAYRVLYLGNKKWVEGNATIAEGDEVVVYGKVVTFGSTPETAQGSAYLYSLNGKTSEGETPSSGSGEAKGSGTLDDPFNVQAAYDAASAMAADVVGDDIVYVKGIISSIKYTFSAQYGTATFNISDDGSETATQFICYGVYYHAADQAWVEGDDQVEVGKEVLVAGKLVNYSGNTPEFSNKTGWLVSIGGNVDPQPSSDAKGTGTLDDPFNAQAAYDAASAMAADVVGDDIVYVKGIISSIKYTFSAQYGTATFNISDDGSETATQFTCYGVYYHAADQAWVEGDDQVEVGKEVVVAGKLVNYGGNTPEFSNKTGWLVSIGGSGTDPGEVDPQPSGDVDFSKAITIKLNNESTWTEATDATYKGGFETTAASGIKVGVYKHSSTSTIITPDQYSVRVYKSGVIAISAPAGKNILGIRFKANDLNNGQYCKDLTVVEPGSGTIKADTGTMLIGDWTGNATKVVFQAAEAQTRLVEAYVVLDGEAGNEEPGEQPGTEVDEYESDLSKVIALADATETKFQGIVSGVTSNSVILTDGTNNFYVYLPATMAAIGDKVKVEGTKTTYGGIPETTSGATLEVVSSGNTVTYGTATDITSSFDSYPANNSVSGYISFTGTLAKSGNYYNVTVEGASTYVGSISNPVSSLNLADLDAKKVKFTGYYVGTSGSSTKYLNLACVKAEEVSEGGNEEPGGNETSSTAYYVKVASDPSAGWAGKYLLVNDTAAKAFSAFSETSTVYGVGADVTITDDGIESSATVDAYQIVISAATVTDGAYTIRFGNNYFSWSSGNSLTGSDTEDANSNWKITYDAASQSVYIVNAADSNRKIRWNSNSPRFACYTSAQTDVQLYKLSE